MTWVKVESPFLEDMFAVNNRGRWTIRKTDKKSRFVLRLDGRYVAAFKSLADAQHHAEYAP